jgi:hypothetical protein
VDQGLKYAWTSPGRTVYRHCAGGRLVLWRKPDRDRLYRNALVIYAFTVTLSRRSIRVPILIPVLPLTYWLITDALERLALSSRFMAVVVADSSL